ncbi:MAG TPA: signal peptidase I [Sphingomicrobium sp.]|nr:signal peptidase I [Sphingomicrobium sp.]
MAFSYARRTGAQTARTERRGGLLRLVLTVLALAWAIRSLVFAPFSIPSGSMLPALFVGDYLLVAKWPYGYSRFSFPFGFPPIDGRILGKLPERGDVVVFRPPGSREDFVKRAIGLPGDTVEVRGGTLVLNGRALPRQSEGRFAMPLSANSPCRVVEGATAMTGQTAGGEPACFYPVYRETLPNGRSYTVIDQVERPRGDDFPATMVPKGHVFLMGDNRDDSLDSRFAPIEGGIGFVPVENLIGRATFVFWSTDGSAEYVKPWTWFSALRAERIGSTFGGDAR